MPSSIRNEIPGFVKTVTRGDILSEVIVMTDVGEIASIITTRSIDSLALEPGDSISAQIKATNVSLCRCDCNHPH